MISQILKEYINGYDAIISTFKYNTNYPFFIKIECLLENNDGKEMEYEEHKYDNITFTKKFYTNSELIKYLINVNEDKGPTFNSDNFKNKLNVDPLNNNDSLIEPIYTELFYDQINPYCIKIEKPLRCIFYKLSLNDRFFKNNSEILLKKGEPLFFPNSQIAFNSLMDLNMDTVYNGILFLIPLHKKHFKNIELSERHVKFEINENAENEYLCIYYSKGSEYESNIIQFVDELDLKFSPDYLEVALIDNEYHILDRRKWSKNFENDKYGIVYKYSEDEVDRLLQLKEDICLERKNFPNYDIICKKRDDLLKTIVAFSNCKGGKIIIGAEDKILDPNDISGFEDTLSEYELKKRMIKIIRSHCNPNIDFNLSIEQIKNRKKILVIDIPEGNRKPYVWNYNNQYRIFIRNGEEDIDCNRDELMNLFQNHNNDTNNRIIHHNNISNLYDSY